MKVTFTDLIVGLFTAIAPFSLPVYYYIILLLIYAALRLAKKENDSF